MIQTTQSIAQMLYDHIFVRIAKNSDASKSFASLVQQMALAEIECSCGYATELSTETDEYIYYPKSFSKKGMYNDPAQDVDTLTQIQLQLSEILQAGHHYTPVEHFIKDLHKATEVELFMYIHGFGGAMFTNRREYKRGNMEMPENEFEAMQNDLQEKQLACLPFLKPFGLDITSESLSEKRADYDKWYSHWKKWMDGFDEAEWRRIEHLLSNDIEAANEYLPETKWNEA